MYYQIIIIDVYWNIHNVKGEFHFKLQNVKGEFHSKLQNVKGEFHFNLQGLFFDTRLLLPMF